MDSLYSLNEAQGEVRDGTGTVTLKNQELALGFSRKKGNMKAHLTPIQAIRAKCMDCSCHQPMEIRECRIITCALWPYRMGTRPKPNELIQVEPKGEATYAAANVG